MRARHPVPTLWLMTDERIVDLDATLTALPRGAGVVFRHHATPTSERRRMFAKVLRIARKRRLVLVRAGAVAMRGEMGVHGAGRMVRPGLRTWPAHDRSEAIAGVRAGADVVFVSPMFATRSHPGAKPVGMVRSVAIWRGLKVMPVALGGMTARRYVRVRALGYQGWAAIDALA